MGRGRKGLINQSDKKISKTCLAKPTDNIIWPIGRNEKYNKPSTVDIPEEVLNELRQMLRRDVANILVNT